MGLCQLQPSKCVQACGVGAPVFVAGCRDATVVVKVDAAIRAGGAPVINLRHLCGGQSFYLGGARVGGVIHPLARSADGFVIPVQHDVSAIFQWLDAVGQEPASKRVNRSSHD